MVNCQALCLLVYRECCQFGGWRLNPWRIILTISRLMCEFVYISHILTCLITTASCAGSLLVKREERNQEHVKLGNASKTGKETLGNEQK